MNLTKGGEITGHGSEHPSALYTENQYISIIKELADTDKELEQVATDLNIKYYIVANISRGRSHLYLKQKYPELYNRMEAKCIPGKRIRKLSAKCYEDILELLAHTDFNYPKIAELMECTESIITSISLGTAHQYLQTQFPVEYALVQAKQGTRSNTKHENIVYINILTALANTSKKLNIIAKECEVDEGVVEDISRGATHKYLAESHPELYTKMISKKHTRRAGSHSGLTYPPVKDPQNVIYHNILNAKQFALEHNLHPGHFGDLLRGKAKSHKGWVLA